ncbi:MAG: phenylacetate-CoA ligase [Acidobacteriota bacterium]|jgi:phenylacetate-CoA ligase|nr:phenylacetate-CoA ligase [Acidobacteriota bacterium]MDT7779697.1 phenylacetate-CoA ligase [Acidobacteriota bacterium]
MIAKLIECAERASLRLSPERAKQMLGMMPDALLKRMQAARFRQTIRLVAASSPFYREEFRRRGIDARSIRRPEDLGDFYTTGDDLRRHGPEAFLTGRPDTAFETTGTTSPVPKQLFFSNRELREVGRAGAMGLRNLGLRREDRVLSAFDCSFWVSPATVRAAFQYIGCFHAEAGKIEPAEFYDRALAYKPNVIFGEPSWLVRLSEIAESRGAWQIKFLFSGGENMTEQARRSVESVWRAPLYMSYGQTEGFGAMGVECAEQNGYHRNDLNYFFEIAGADGEGYGELVYTTLNREVMPLVRYRSTDITRMVDEPCPCGFFIKRIGKIRARCDEMVVCGMGNVGPWVFAELLRDAPGAGSEWQAVIKNDGRCDSIELHVEMNDPSAQYGVEKSVLDNLRAGFADFWKNREMKLYELRVVACAPNTLRAKRKLKRVVDERQMLYGELAKL